MSQSPVLSMQGICKRFGSLAACDGISLELAAGEVLALLGENGAGKTTLMNVLFGHYVADAGEIEAFGKPLPPGSPAAAIDAGIGMVHQHFTLADNLSVLDNIIVGTEPLWRPVQRRAGARSELLDLAQRFGLRVDPEARVGSLAVGERQRVEILKALYRQAKVLILDEPTAVLTPQETEGLFATLRDMASHGLAIIFISHKLAEVLSIADRIAVLRQGRIVSAVHREAANKVSLAAAMIGRPMAKPRREPIAPGKPLLTMRGVSVDARGGRLNNVSLTAHAHEIVGIAGVSGNGQGALADVLSGLGVPTGGSIELQGSAVRRFSPAAMMAAGVGRIPEDRQARGVVGDLDVSENLILERYREPAISRFGWLRRRAIRDTARRLIDRFDVRCQGPDTAARSLSGGNMQKLVLARVLDRQPRLIVASQPTRGLDVGATAYVHELLFQARARGSAVLLISEDLEELLALCDRIAVIYRGRVNPARPVEQTSMTELGLLMSGHDDLENAA